jgi:hypothetical protein
LSGPFRTKKKGKQEKNERKEKGFQKVKKKVKLSP